MKKYEKQPWTSDERNVLRDYYYVLSMEQLLDVLPGRSPNAIRKQVAYLKKTRLVFQERRNADRLRLPINV